MAAVGKPLAIVVAAVRLTGFMALYVGTEASLERWRGHPSVAHHLTGSALAGLLFATPGTRLLGLGYGIAAGLLLTPLYYGGFIYKREATGKPLLPSYYSMIRTETLKNQKPKPAVAADGAAVDAAAGASAAAAAPPTPVATAAAAAASAPAAVPPQPPPSSPPAAMQ